MIDKLKLAEARYSELENQLADPETVGDQKKFRDFMREYKSLTPLVEKYREYAKAKAAYEEAQELLSDSSLETDFREMAQAQL
ncbi:MAG: PCRF domain-containing protein, partial [Oscillospiraceae bacterium]|nr:PCRF domain-containing protein [Oscillospiraceae bacterium]